jgi:enamine deaminase RidA (YjgF/YER057c/UK114 family)
MEAGVEQRAINPWTWQEQFRFSHGIEVVGGERALYLAGQASVDGEGRAVHAGDMQAQIGQALDNIEAVLSRAGYSFRDVVRLNYYVTDIDLFFENIDVLLERLTAHDVSPSGTLLRISGLAFPELLVEMEATAVR